MTLVRACGLVLVLGGIVGATVHDRLPIREIPRVDGRFVLTADFHVHAFPGDGGLAAWELSREARRRELDVIVVTNHNQRLAAQIAATGLRRPVPEDPLTIVGQEVTAPGFHLVAAGIQDVVDWRLSASDAVRAIHAQGGVAIAAHPGRHSWRPDENAEALALLDGAEVAHPATIGSNRLRQELAAFFEAASTRNPSLAPVGSSDFHFGGALGLCRTYLFVDEISQRGVLDALRAGLTVAYDGHGRLSGEPARVEAVRTLVARHPPPLRADLRSRTASWISLAGLLILLLFR